MPRVERETAGITTFYLIFFRYMLGAIIGDIVGSRFEFNSAAVNPDFRLFTDECSFTDDTICTIAIADAIMNGKPYDVALREWCRKYPKPMGGYGGMFADWVFDDHVPANPSYGNGAAMRISPVGWLFNDYHQILDEARAATVVSHNHEEAVKGAQCIAVNIYWLRTQRATKEQLAAKMEKRWGYEMLPLGDVIRIGGNGHFDSICQETVPWAVSCLIESNDFEGAIRKAILCKGDTDTKAAITGSMAEAIYPIPDEMIAKAFTYLPDDMLQIIEQFCQRMEKLKGNDK